MIATRRKIYTDKILDNLLAAQKNMASAEKVDAKGLVYLSRFILRLLKQLDDEVIELCAEAEGINSTTGTAAIKGEQVNYDDVCASQEEVDISAAYHESFKSSKNKIRQSDSSH